MEEAMRASLIEHMLKYLKSYTERGCTREAAMLNYVREFGARLHLTILALLENHQ